MKIPTPRTGATALGEPAKVISIYAPIVANCKGPSRVAARGPQVRDRYAAEPAVRRVMTEISGGQSKRKGRPTVPMPRFT